MIIADTSAWVEYLRHTGSSTNLALRAALAREEVLVIDPVRMEVLAGARNPRHRRQLLAMLEAQETEAVVPVDDWQAAAELSVGCRTAGATVRSLLDCLIAAIAIRVRVPVLHHDRDFVRLAAVTALEAAPGSLSSS